MKQILFIVILFLIFSCAKKVDQHQVNKETGTQEGMIRFKSNFILQNEKLFGFIDSYIERCKKTESIDSSEIDNNIYTLYIYQNDFFTRIKLSFMSPNKALLRYTTLGSGYFEYKGRIFIVITGLEPFCNKDFSLQKELQILLEKKCSAEQISKDSIRIELLQPFTWEADIIGDTILNIKATINPRNPPPADTAELYKYIRSIKSFKRL